MRKLEAQARICPFCFDDHSTRRECTQEDLRDRMIVLFRLYSESVCALYCGLNHTETCKTKYRTLVEMRESKEIKK